MRGADRGSEVALAPWNLRPPGGPLERPAPTEACDVLKLLDAALEELTELPRMDDARFLETHRLYEGRSDQRERIIDALCLRVAEQALGDGPGQKPSRRLPARRVPTRRVLGVGCGDGEVDLPLARTMASATDELVYVGVDPSQSECAGFERLFGLAELPRVRLELAVQGFEGFETALAFDLVHFVHSLYYMDDPARALVKARELLTPDGLLVVLQAPREELNELAACFYDKQYERPTLFSEDIAGLLEGWDWPFERVRLDARIDVTPLIHGDAEVGSALRDFIVQVDGRRLPPDVRELVERYLRSVAFTLGDRAFIAHPVDAFFIRG